MFRTFECLGAPATDRRLLASQSPTTIGSGRPLPSFAVRSARRRERAASGYRRGLCISARVSSTPLQQICATVLLSQGLAMAGQCVGRCRQQPSVRDRVNRRRSVVCERFRMNGRSWPNLARCCYPSSHAAAIRLTTTSAQSRFDQPLPCNLCAYRRPLQRWEMTTSYE